jgi:hypothetical protein
MMQALFQLTLSLPIRRSSRASVNESTWGGAGGVPDARLLKPVPLPWMIRLEVKLARMHLLDVVFDQAGMSAGAEGVQVR